MMSAPLQDLLASYPHVWPEAILVGFSLLAAGLAVWWGDRLFGAISLLGIAALVAAGIAAIAGGSGAPVSVFQGAMVIDGVGVFAKALIAFSAAATLALGADHFIRTKEQRFEFPIMVTLAVLGMFVMASAQDLISLYVGVELQSLAAYVLAAWRRDDANSSEAGLKYFVLSAIASGLLLFGASFVYGFTGSIHFDAIAAAVGEGAGGVGLTFGLVLMLCALAFKMSAAPFHMWTPDVYEGAPTPVTAFFAAAPKVAAVALMARVLYGPFAGLEDQWRQVIAALAAISMAWGAIGALLQTNLKRLMAYSSIGNMGFVLMGLASGVEQGPSSALIYLALYPGLGKFAGSYKWTSVGQYEAEEARATETFGPIFAKYAAMDIPAVAADPQAREIGQRLFLNYCSQCHASDARGSRGFPNLADKDWLYGGEPMTIKQSILNGRMGIMPPMGAMIGDDGVKAATQYVLSLAGLNHDQALAQKGKNLFATNCAACHGVEARGNQTLGAPNLTDNIWLYGSSEKTISETIQNGRPGQMH